MKAKCKANRLLAMLLSLVMLVGLLPTTALAAGENAVTEVNFTLSGYELGKKVVDVKPAISTNGVTWYSNYASYGASAYLVAQGDDGEIRQGIVDDTATFAASTQYWLVVWFKADNGYDISALTQEDIKLNGASAAETTILSGENEGVIAAFFKLDKLTGSTPSTPTVVDTVDFTLSGYELGKKVVEVKPTISTSGVAWGGENKYDGAYFVAKGDDFSTREKISDDTATFAANTQYWLGVLFKADDDYDISALTQEKIRLNGVPTYKITQYSSVGSVAAFFKLDKLTDPTPSTPTVVDAVDFTLNGYELGKKVVDVKPVISTSGVTWNGENEYCGAYAVWQSEDDPNSIPDLIPADSTAAFAADTQYWLSVLCKAVDGYDISTLTMENIKLDGVAADGIGVNIEDGSIHADFKLNKLTESTPTEYTITFDANGGTLTGDSTAQTDADGRLTALPSDPARDGYRFDGWFTAATDGEKASLDTVYSGDTTLYAHWTKETSGGGSSGGGSSGGSGGGSTGKPAENPPVTPVTPVTPPSDTKEIKFTDTRPSDYYYDAVQWAVNKEITSGTSETTFSPDAPCTRAQMATFLWRTQGRPETAADNRFRDVPSGSYYETAVVWALEKGITTGLSATVFGPDETLTRAQMVTMLWRAAGSPAAKAAAAFADVPSDSYYAQAVAWAAENGITTGTGNGRFSPNEACTRAQIVTFLYRTYGK